MLLRFKRGVLAATVLMLDALREVHQLWHAERLREAEELLVILETESKRVSDRIAVARCHVGSPQQLTVPAEIRDQFQWLEVNDPLVYRCMGFVDRRQLSNTDALIMAVVEQHRRINAYKAAELKRMLSPTTREERTDA